MRLVTADGYRISAIRYEAQARLQGHLIVAGATGVPQGFYRRFAEYASARGFTTLTLDYRGIGPGSLYPHLWGRPVGPTPTLPPFVGYAG